MAKRFFDFWAALFGLIVVSPLLLVVAALIISIEGRPVLFLQQRVGQFGVPFNCVKFRTMKVGTPQVGTHHAPAGAVTPLGMVLRRFKLDELPQLYNVLLGQMSLVGPRPCLPNQIELIEARKIRGLDVLRPGITGISQVAGLDMRDPEVLANSDAKYLGGQSLWGDVKLILATLKPHSH